MDIFKKWYNEFSKKTAGERAAVAIMVTVILGVATMFFGNGEVSVDNKNENQVINNNIINLNATETKLSSSPVINTATLNLVENKLDYAEEVIDKGDNTLEYYQAVAFIIMNKYHERVILENKQKLDFEDSSLYYIDRCSGGYSQETKCYTSPNGLRDFALNTVVVTSIDDDLDLQVDDSFRVQYSGYAEIQDGSSGFTTRIFGDATFVKKLSGEFKIDNFAFRIDCPSASGYDVVRLNKFHCN